VASEVRLFEHEDFDQALLQAAGRHGVSEQFVEKDYYVTEILRIIATTYGQTAVFKGGTSLSKGWKLITRFSEDIDLFVNLENVKPTPTRRQIDAALKQMADAVSRHPALSLDPKRRNTSSGAGRRDYFAYATRFDELPGISSGVLLEPGVRSGTFPTVVAPISSLVGEHLVAEGASGLAEDLASFEMTLLHFRRTFVEKLFALHDRVRRFEQDGTPLAREARHYPDVYVLAGNAEVLAMLRSDEYMTIRDDCHAKSAEFFPGQQAPSERSFANSPALFPTAAVLDELARDYEAQCDLLFGGQDYPPFDSVLGRFESLRDLL
jgi:Nucleotidyl transferase AbiEii toxin, Type IV TA system